ncbi:Outer membrane protein (porin) [Ferrimonas sediminum]|uniref:Outer membrane protein (Porin) n=2 Tax=Ferrimonas sediminum TaxID=718193 RepID=A0A1G8KKU9_9GAMM|nr:porin [Ferrimonas sediminum]SDI44083.1 Outer membrane protein (porin) [Ferrimonas sediminum]
MQKRTLALSVASIFAAASFGAMAEMPTFYGDLNISVTDSDTGYTVQGTSNDKGTVLENNSSNIGIKGSHEINSALKLVYKAEFGVNGTDNDADTFSSRNTYLGLAGGFGEVVFGRNDTAFKGSEGGADAFGNLNADITMILPGQDRVADGVTYTLPSMGLVSAKATYILEDDNDGATSDDGDNFALMVGYGDKKLKKANYYVGAGYVDGIKGLTAYRITGQVKVGELALGAIYQDSEKTSDSSIDATGYTLSAKYPLGNFMLKAQYGFDDGGMGTFAKKANADDTNTGTVEDVTNYTIGGDYTLSKAAYVYGHYAYYDASVKGAEDIDDSVFTVGLRYRF